MTPLEGRLRVLFEDVPVPAKPKSTGPAVTTAKMNWGGTGAEGVRMEPYSPGNIRRIIASRGLCISEDGDLSLDLQLVEPPII